MVADDQLHAHTTELATRLANGPTFAFAQTKTLIREGEGRSLPEQLQAELAAGLLCGRSVDGGEALRAAMEKRPAHFCGQ